MGEGLSFCCPLDSRMKKCESVLLRLYFVLRCRLKDLSCHSTRLWCFTFSRQSGNSKTQLLMEAPGSPRGAELGIPLPGAAQSLLHFAAGNSVGLQQEQVP